MCLGTEGVKGAGLSHMGTFLLPEEPNLFQTNPISSWIFSKPLNNIPRCCFTSDVSALAAGPSAGRNSYCPPRNPDSPWTASGRLGAVSCHPPRAAYLGL
ncbi:hypothetical protein FKM82_014888 [Ascaphus truei]